MPTIRGSVISMRIVDEFQYQYAKFRDYLLAKTVWLRNRHHRFRQFSNAILIIRLDAIGDCILWLDQAKEYRKSFPDHKLVLLHNKAWSEIAERLPWFDECIPFDREKIGDVKYYRSLIKKINNYSYEKVFSPVFSRDFVTVDWIVHNVNAKHKIGYKGDYQNNYWIENYNLYVRKHKGKWDFKAIADSWYTSLVPNDSNCVMELQRNAHFIRQTINPNFQSQLPVFPFETPKPNYITQSDYVVLFLGASTIHRTWPITSFVTIADAIPNDTILLCGSSDDRQLTSEFVDNYQGDKNVIDICGKTTLIELINIIANAAIVITNETSASHIAVATRTPSICLLGGGHYGRFQPYQVDSLSDDDKKALPVVVTCKNHSCFGCNWKCKYPFVNDRWRCIAEISPEDVIAALVSHRSYDGLRINHG
jgi:ADP-heptose:LPS heptosyltransferase